MQVFKQRVSRQMRSKKRDEAALSLFPKEEAELRRFWQRRCYGFNVHTGAKRKENLVYMHGNPIKEKLVERAGDWPWSSWSYYATGERLLRTDTP
jgi:hypothetical protein